jgi:hypothetical protein
VSVRGARALSIAAAVVVVLVSLFASRRALADDELARRHFRRGVELYDKKEYAEAERAFRLAYGEKPSPGIKQNIALSLKGQGKHVAAATAFDEALEEGQASLPAETKAAIEAELAELVTLVATVNLRVEASGTQRPIDDVTVTVDDARLPRGAHRRPIRLSPGIHVFTAEAPGYGSPPEKKLALVAGQPVDATFEMPPRPAAGTLTVRADVPDAQIRVDGADVGRGSWSGEVPSGVRIVEVSAEGRATTRAEVMVTAGTSVDFPVALREAAAAPAAYVAPERKPPPKPKKRYVVPMLGLFAQSLRLSSALDEPPDGTTRTFSGGGLGVRGGYRFTPMVAVELHAEVGSVRESYRVRPSDAVASETSVAHFVLAPMLRFSTRGRARFTAASGVGVRHTSLEATLARADATESRKGAGVAASWLVDAGVQVDAGSLFLEGVLFADLHGVGSVRDEVSDARLLLVSPALRVGARVGLGIPF